MSNSSFVGNWLLKRTGKARATTDVPGAWRAALRADRLVVRDDGTFTRHIGGIQRNGTWKLDGEKALVQETGFEPVRVTLRDGVVLWPEQDEEHGGYLFLEFAPEPAFSLEDAAARLKKTREPAKLIAREGWVERALREGNSELLALCLQHKGEVFPETLRDLNDCPAAALPAMVAALLAQPAARKSLLAALPRSTAAVASAVLAQVAPPEGAALAQDVALAMAAAPLGLSAATFEVFCAAATSLDVRDAAGVPLLFHVVLRAPLEWVRIARRRADATVTLQQPARLAGDWNLIELPAGIDVKEAAARCAAAIEAMPMKQAWHLDVIAELRAKAAAVTA